MRKKRRPEYAEAKPRRRRPNANFELRELDSIIFDPDKPPPKFFKAFFRRYVLPRLTIPGRYKLDEKQAIATTIAFALVHTGLKDFTVADSRETSNAGVRARVQLWDAFVKADLARRCLGSESSGHRTRYQATPKLLTLRRQWREKQIGPFDAIKKSSEVFDPTDLTLVEIRSRAGFDPSTGRLMPRCKKPWAVKPIWEQEINLMQSLEDSIERINRSNLGHIWQAFWTNPKTGRQTMFQPDIRLREVHAEKLFRANRLYTCGPFGAQNLPKSIRRGILIDGEPGTEFDFSGMDTRLLYHRVRLDPDREQDIYVPEKIFPRLYGFENLGDDRKQVLRDFVKRVTNICWHVGKREQAHSSVGKLLREHDEARYLRQAIYQIEKTNPKDIVRRVEAAHAEVAKRFAEQLPDIGTPFFTRYGMELMGLDGSIMRHILLAFADAQKPVLGIHDALLCKQSDAEFAIQTMYESYFQFMMFEPVIRRVF